MGSDVLVHPFKGAAIAYFWNAAAIADRPQHHGSLGKLRFPNRKAGMLFFIH
jgi:hypothetical protein